MFCFIGDLKIFQKFYSRLVSLLPISKIEHKLVSAEVITMDDIEEINGMTKSKDKAKYVLNIIVKSLEAGITSSFYALLNVMNEYGGDLTSLAKEIRREVNKSSGNSYCIMRVYIYYTYNN